MPLLEERTGYLARRRLATVVLGAAFTLIVAGPASARPTPEQYAAAFAQVSLTANRSDDHP
jgi:hypothetical protein